MISKSSIKKELMLIHRKEKNFLTKKIAPKKYYNSIFLLLFMAIMFLFVPFQTLANEDNAPQTPTQSPHISASSAVLMDRNTGRLLYGKNMNRRRPVASTTKIMTALLALEKGDLSKSIKTSKNAAETGGSSVYLGEGEVKTLEELLYGLMLRSGNDAAVAIAEHIGGSVDEFAVMMTEKAKEIGAINTNFMNPHGLHHDDHVSTAHDMALITSYALKNPDFARFASTSHAIISWPGEEWDRVLHNQNKLLDIYEGGDGVKTGWTTPAGRCVVGSATRDGWQLVVVLLDAPEMWEDAVTLLDYGFNSFKYRPIFKKDRVVKTVEITRSLQEWGNISSKDDFYFPLLPEEEAYLQYKFHLNEPYRAPLKKGYTVGAVEVFLRDEPLGLVELVISEDILRASFIERVRKRIQNILNI